MSSAVTGETLYLCDGGRWSEQPGGALALSRAADAWSLDVLMASLRQRRPVQPHPDDGEYTWPIRFVWVAMALIFCAAGISRGATMESIRRWRS